MWRDHVALPEDLVFKVNYLGAGYTRIHRASQETAKAVAAHLDELGAFDVLTDASDLPVLAFSVKKEIQERFTVFDLSDRLRDRGWLVPAYTFPQNREDLAVLRIVVREGFSRDLGEMPLADVGRHLDYFAQRHAGVAPAPRSGFHH